MTLFNELNPYVIYLTAFFSVQNKNRAIPNETSDMQTNKIVECDRNTIVRKVIE